MENLNVKEDVKKVVESGALAPMAKAAPIKKVDSIFVTGNFSIQNSNGNDYLLAVLDNPFVDEFFGELRLSFNNPNKKDSWGKEYDRYGDRFEGAFRHCVKKSGQELVPFTGQLFYYFFTDRKGIKSDFISIMIDSPFSESNINDNRPVRVFFKSGVIQGAFDIVAMSRLNLTAAPRR